MYILHASCHSIYVHSYICMCLCVYIYMYDLYLLYRNECSHLPRIRPLIFVCRPPFALTMSSKCCSPSSRQALDCTDYVFLYCVYTLYMSNVHVQYIQYMYTPLMCVACDKMLAMHRLCVPVLYINDIHCMLHVTRCLLVKVVYKQTL